MRGAGWCAAALGAAAIGCGAELALAGEGASLRDQFRERFAGKPAPDLALPDLSGRTVRLSTLRGKVVLLNFWYSSCPPCRKETPDLVLLRKRHAARGFEVLGINLDAILMPGAGSEPLQSFLKQVAIPYPVLLADTKAFRDYGEIPVQPMTFLVDRNGLVARIFMGAFSGAVLERAITPYLQAAPPAARP